MPRWNKMLRKPESAQVLRNKGALNYALRMILGADSESLPAGRKTTC